jgi:ankyrin repeat protein
VEKNRIESCQKITMGHLLSKCFGADNHALAILCVTNGDDKALLTLLQKTGGKRVKINERNLSDEGKTLVAMASERGFNKVVTVLIDRGADVNIASDSGFTPLNLALKNGHSGTATILINSGADLDSHDTAFGKTPLLWAVEKKVAPTTIKLLCDKGCDLDARSRQGFTALMTAVEHNNADVVRVLLASNANPLTQDLKGNTALSRAKALKYNLVQQLLEQKVSELCFGGNKSSTTSSKKSSSSPDKDEKGRRKSGGIMAGKSALGSQLTDLVAGGRAHEATAATKERMKDIVFKSKSLDAALDRR